MNKTVLVFCLSLVPAIATAQQAEPKLVYDESDQQRIELGRKNVAELSETFDVMIENMNEKERDAMAKNFNIIDKKRSARINRGERLPEEDVTLTEYKGELGKALSKPFDIRAYAPLSAPKEVPNE